VEVDCHQCRQKVLRALDEGEPVTVDANPIRPEDEVAILLAGRRTYARLRGGDLVHRHAGRIRYGLVGEKIHAAHVCGGYSQPALSLANGGAA
jgi:hypothetical protein